MAAYYGYALRRSFADIVIKWNTLRKIFAVSSACSNLTDSHRVACSFVSNIFVRRVRRDRAYSVIKFQHGPLEGNFIAVPFHRVIT